MARCGSCKTELLSNCRVCPNCRAIGYDQQVPWPITVRLAIALGAGASVGGLIFVTIYVASVLLSQGSRTVPLNGIATYVLYLACIAAVFTFAVSPCRTRRTWTH